VRVTMLSKLRIQNYALLKEVEVEFGPGLNILTGETGAGKSIIIGALNIAVGERGYAENIRTGEEKAVVEAVFDMRTDGTLKDILNTMLDAAGIETIDEYLVIKREINRASKGRVFINSNAASLSFLQDIGRFLIDIHGQHEHQSLLKTEVHIDLLDDYAGNSGLRLDVKGLYSGISALNTEIKRLRKLEEEKQEKLDIINYRINEIEQAQFTIDTELDDTLAAREKMIHAESLKESVNNVIMALSPSSFDLEGFGALEKLEEAKQNLEDIKKIDPKAADEFLMLLEDAVIKAGEVKNFFMEYMDSVEFDRQALSSMEARIDIIESLMKKYKKKDIREIRAYYGELAEEKKKIELNSGMIKEKEAEKEAVLKELAVKCVKLSEIRHSMALELGKKIEIELRDLGIAKAVFVVEVNEPEAENADSLIIINGKKHMLGPLGINEAEFLMSMNPGEDVKPLSKIASGGEISRIMLAVKNILSSVDRIPVLVFDEIDTGISGKIGQVTGRKLKQISSKKQILCITHLAQIAAFSDIHFSVEKHVVGDKTETVIRKLDANDKMKEIAKLISGEKITDASLKAAEGLIHEAV
jgi:DNA repair protein RecN (Recombination protein N)